MMKVFVAAALAVATLAASVQGATYRRLVTCLIGLDESYGALIIYSCRKNAWLRFR